jgi:hypothetical protein
MRSEKAPPSKWLSTYHTYLSVRHFVRALEESRGPTQFSLKWRDNTFRNIVSNSEKLLQALELQYILSQLQGRRHIVYTRSCVRL